MLGGIIFSQMLTPTGGKHKPFQTGALDNLTERKDQTEVHFSTNHDLIFTANVNAMDCLSHNLHVNMKGNGCSQLKLFLQMSHIFLKY